MMKKERRPATGQVSDEFLIALMTDVDVAVPGSMGVNVDPGLARTAVVVGGNFRHRLVNTAKSEIAKRPAEKVKILLGLVKYRAYAESDAISAHGLKRAKVECRKGCAWCCHQNVETSIPEAILIAVEIDEPNDVRGDAVDRAAPRFEVLDDAARVKSGEPCPFLNAEHDCSIYDIRPIACRSYFSPDAAQCKAAFDAVASGSGDVDVTTHGYPQLVGSGLRAGLNGLLKDLGLQHDDVDLISTVAAIRKDPSLIDRWGAGEHVFIPRMSQTDRPLASFTE